ncbi:MAG TPA: DUF997 family protein [Pirellulales bacterium]
MTAFDPPPQGSPVSPARTEDLLLRSARREALFALAVWLISMVYTITYCYLNGYNRAPESLTFVLWFPDWVFWGIVVPWITCVIVSTWFAFRFMGDEPLADESSLPASAAGETLHG